MTSTTATATQYPDSQHNYTTTMDSASCDKICIFYAVANVIICVLGVTGNGLVIWITGFKVKKTVISTWYLSLATFDFLYCSFLIINVINVVKNDWNIGLIMCKFMYFHKFLNWYSSILLLVIISVDRCVVVMFPVWAQNQRTVRKASSIVILAWIISAALSSPAFIFQIVVYSQYRQKSLCIIRYDYFTVTVLISFIFFFVIPFLIIVVCYVLMIRKLNTNQMTRSRKLFKIMTMLIVSFLICWLPYHTVNLMKITGTFNRFLSAFSVFSRILANANSCLNPFLYAFMGKDFKKECSALLSKIESAVVEEDVHNVVQQTAITASVENNLSTAV